MSKKTYADAYSLISSTEASVATMEFVPNTADDVALEFIHSGSYILNAQLSGSLFGGYAVGRVTTHSGLPKTGKSYLLYNGIRECQAAGYHCILRDTESAVLLSRLMNMGIDLDPDKFTLSNPETVEEMIVSDTKLTNKLRGMKAAGGSIPKIAIFIDSLTALNSQKQYDDAESGAVKVDQGTIAKAMHQYVRMMTTRFEKFGIPVICTAHVWDKPIPGTPLKKKAPSTQGTGFQFMSSVITMLSKRVDREKTADKNIMGVIDREIKGIIVTSKIFESRFCKHIPVTFYLSFLKSMNPYLGLLSFCSWDVCGIDKGSWKDTVDLAYEFISKKLVNSPSELVGVSIDEDQLSSVLAKAKFKTWQSAVANHIKSEELVRENGGWRFTDKILLNVDENGEYPKPTGTMPVVNHNTLTYIVEHLPNVNVKQEQLYTSKVFTKEVLNRLDVIIQDYFKLPKTAIEIEHDDMDIIDQANEEIFNI